MEQKRSYPDDDDIKVQWTRVHKAIVFASFMIWPGFICISDVHTFAKGLSLAGLHLGVLGVVLCSLKTPPYGLFVDGGELEFKRARVERRYFQAGLWLVGLGFLVQAGAIL